MLQEYGGRMLTEGGFLTVRTGKDKTKPVRPKTDDSANFSPKFSLIIILKKSHPRVEL